MLLCCIVSSISAADPPRLLVDRSGHFLVTEDGASFFWMGDTAWSIIDQSVRQTRDDQPGVKKYFKIRKEQGFNVVQTHFLTNLVRGAIDAASNAAPYDPSVGGRHCRWRGRRSPA